MTPAIKVDNALARLILNGLAVSPKGTELSELLELLQAITTTLAVSPTESASLPGRLSPETGAG